MTAPAAGAPPTSGPSVGDPIKASTIQQIVAALSAQDSGSVNVPVPTAGATASVNVTFATGRFSSPPIVQVTGVTGVPSSITCNIWVNNVTATGCTINVQKSSAIAEFVNWFASDTP